MKILSGKDLSSVIRHEISVETAKLKIRPKLAVILVGNNPASLSYVLAKQKACSEVGIESYEVKFPDTISESELISTIKTLNADNTVHGILVQLPLPSHISESAVINTIDPAKDVDGFTPVNVGKMVLGEDCFLPCTPHGILKLIDLAGIDLSGKHAVVIGRSNIVGKPIATLLARKTTNATVTLCHTGTKDLEQFTKTADLIVVATGKPHTLTGDMVKPGVIIIDVGVNRIPDATREKGFRLVGDVDFDSCAPLAGGITPVPGGVGPMTITMLLRNVLDSAKKFQMSKDKETPVFNS